MGVDMMAAFQYRGISSSGKFALTRCHGPTDWKTEHSKTRWDFIPWETLVQNLSPRRRHHQSLRERRTAQWVTPFPPGVCFESGLSCP